MPVYSPSKLVDTINWTAPWLKPLSHLAEPLIRSSSWINALNAAAERQQLHQHRGLPLRFVPQCELPHNFAYESFISDTGKVPTRDNLHDFFNGLIWLAYPNIKVQLNALQSTEIARRTGKESDRRGPARDAATLFDENAAFFVVRRTFIGRRNDDVSNSVTCIATSLDGGEHCANVRLNGQLVDSDAVEKDTYAESATPPDLTMLLRTHRWTELFIDERTRFGSEGTVHLFGHALMEKLVRPYKAITAHALTLEAEDEFFLQDDIGRRALLDAAIATRLAAHGIAKADFTPLPVLGIPGWHSAQDAFFYADQQVFRPKR